MEKYLCGLREEIHTKLLITWLVTSWNIDLYFSPKYHSHIS